MQFLVCRRAAVSLVSAAILFFAVGQNAMASTVVVTPPNTTPCKSLPSYPTISQAVASVPVGSTIYVCPGTYAEQVVITKKLTITGVAANGLAGTTASGANNPIIASPAGGVAVNTSDLYQNPNGEPTAAQVLIQTPPNLLSTPISVTISNITVDGSNNGISGCGTDLVGFYFQNASGTLNHVTARYQELAPADFGCQDGLAIYVQSGYGTGGTAVVTVENASVHDYDKNGITADGSGTVATIVDNYVVGIGATPLIAQNGIQMSYGARGSINGNIVTDDVYINPSDCSLTTNPYCYSASGILLYDSGGASGTPVTINSNTISNTQGAIVTYTDGVESADYNNLTSNKITTVPAIVSSVAGTVPLDGIDLCSNNNTATSNTVFNASGAGVHLDSSCFEPGGASTGVGTATNNTVNEACAGVILGNSGGTSSGTGSYNVVETTATGNSCPAGSPNSPKAMGKARPQPKRR
ncbi:MAG TPA: hypothetical protein VND65_12300 [Candidatus Binatia bacterium]|nr:hypothetical protein [Candidatus Binatia bacterium]